MEYFMNEGIFSAFIEFSLGILQKLVVCSLTLNVEAIQNISLETFIET